MADLTTLQVDISTHYIPSLAENGKFVNITPQSLASLGYPLTTFNADGQPMDTFGKQAVLVYNIAPTTTSSSAPISAFVVNNPQASNITINSGYYTNSATVITPSTPLKSLELFNYDYNIEAYIMLSATNFDNLTALGIPVEPRGYYNYNQTITSFTVGLSTGPANLRIIGHY